MEFSIVIPAYNESSNIIPSLNQVIAFMRELSPSFEVIVVDDGSSDNTANLVEKFSSENSEVVLIRNPHKGKGPTVFTGMMAAQGDYIYMADADMSAPISELKKLVVWLVENDYDIVIASRQGAEAERLNEPFHRHLMGRIFNLFVQLIALPGINDSQCGFKLFKKSVAKNVFSRLHIYGEDAKTIDKAYMGAFDVEVLYIAKKLNYKIKELPVKWVYVKTSRLNPISDSIGMLRDVFHVRLNDLKGKYKLSAPQ